MRILIVEDEIKIRRGLAGLIAKATDNEIVGEARNGREGLELILHTNPDLVITDVRMPEMDGLEMLQAMKERNLDVHCVILSGYSEFSYAKKAIGYGVDDYLLKPLAPEDILGLLKTIEEKREQEGRRRSGATWRILWNWTSGAVMQAKEQEADLAELHMKKDSRYCLLAGYGWDTLPAERREWLERIQGSDIKQNFSDLHCCIFEETRELVCILPEEAAGPLLHELAWHLQCSGHKWVWAKAPVESLMRMQETMTLLRTLYLYGREAGQIVTPEDMQAFQGEALVYPKELEGKLQAAVYREDGEQIRKQFAAFRSYMEGRPFWPRQVKEGYGRLVHRILSWLEDAEKHMFEKLEPFRYAERIRTVYTREEMNRILDELLHELENAAGHKEGISNYAIKKAISYIRIHYAENISLEEIADRLDITPEYLSTLFNREVGMNFTVFLRDFRISHARRLLKGTDKKIYEIAQEVGYPDSKYFNRVFKEKMGISPREFRQM